MEIASEFRAAFENHRTGRLEAAEQCCLRILAADPNHADALHLSGLIAFEKGNVNDAIAQIARAIELDGSRPAFQNNLGNILKAQGKLDEAIASFHRAIALGPSIPAIHTNLGNTFELQG